MASTSSPSRFPSIREVARIAGVAPATVSRAFNADQRDVSISPGTRKKIDAVCRQLNYHPNIHATRLFAKRSNAIALVVPSHGHVLPHAPSFTDANLAKTLAGLTEAAARHEQQLVLMAIDQAFLETQHYLQVLRNRSVDGMIVWGATADDMGFIQQINQERWPLVLINGHPARNGEGMAAPQIQLDNAGGAAGLAKRLIALGHRRIVYIAGPDHAQAAIERRRGFEDACRDAGVAVQLRRGEFSFEDGKRLAGELLDGRGGATAIAAASDLIALGAIEAAQERGLRVPEDISITGADDAFPYYKPRLTTFRAPMEELGRQSLVTLLDNIATREGSRDGEKESGRDGRNVGVSPAWQTLPVEVVAGATVATA